jgi:hypothetical protein
MRRFLIAVAGFVAPSNPKLKALLEKKAPWDE